MRISVLLTCFLFICATQSVAQTETVVSHEATTLQRQKTYRNLVQNSIQNNLSHPLSAETEDKWIDAFQAMIFLQYQTGWTNLKIHEAIQQSNMLSASFSKNLVEYIYALQIAGYQSEVAHLARSANDISLVSICLLYLLDVDKSDNAKKTAFDIIQNRPVYEKDSIWLSELKNRATEQISDSLLPIYEFLKPDYMPGKTVLLIVQRKNRNYPGLCLVRDSSGNWIRDSMNNLFQIPMLARSQNGLPGYITNGNTPSGIFRMDGFGQSKAGFIGPSTNIQLTLPFEYKAGHFFYDSTLTDSAWLPERYANLLPVQLRHNFSLFQAYRAGLAGRREIIIHGSAVDPLWYRSAPYFPFTPTQGCLSTYESWDPQNGQRLISGQQTLVDMIRKAGGPFGYAIVVDLDNKAEPVTMDEINGFLKMAGIR